MIVVDCRRDVVPSDVFGENDSFIQEKFTHHGPTLEGPLRVCFEGPSRKPICRISLLETGLSERAVFGLQAKQRKAQHGHNSFVGGGGGKRSSRCILIMAS